MNFATLSGWWAPRARHVLRGSIAAGLLAVLTGCTTASLEDLAPSTAITPKLAREIRAKGLRENDAVLVRIFKEESELEVWKRKASGEYALLKTYPICRWSGKLGPKKKSGDRQAPEGFYSVSAGNLNPKSQYYLSFNLGYPNRLERALGYSGEALMVHGACSSSGCYAMTDQGVSEIYSIVQAALKGGQGRFQVHAFPFRMTDRKMAMHADDANISFWRDLKAGYDHFERKRTEPSVAMCGGRYRINMAAGAEMPDDPLAACPAASDPLMTASTTVDTTDASAVHAYAYVDGGMHPSFRKMLKAYGPDRMAKRVSKIKYPISRPEAALSDPFQPNGQ